MMGFRLLGAIVGLMGVLFSGATMAQTSVTLGSFVADRVLYATFDADLARTFLSVDSSVWAVPFTIQGEKGSKGPKTGVIVSAPNALIDVVTPIKQGAREKVLTVVVNGTDYLRLKAKVANQDKKLLEGVPSTPLDLVTATQIQDGGSPASVPAPMPVVDPTMMPAGAMPVMVDPLTGAPLVATAPFVAAAQ